MSTNSAQPHFKKCKCSPEFLRFPGLCVVEKWLSFHSETRQIRFQYIPGMSPRVYVCMHVHRPIEKPIPLKPIPRFSYYRFIPLTTSISLTISLHADLHLSISPFLHLSALNNSNLRLACETSVWKIHTQSTTKASERRAVRRSLHSPSSSSSFCLLPRPFLS